MLMTSTSCCRRAIRRAAGNVPEVSCLRTILRACRRREMRSGHENRRWLQQVDKAAPCFRISIPVVTRVSERCSADEDESVNDCKPISRKLVFERLQSVTNPTSIHGLYPYRGKMSPFDAMNIIRQLPRNGYLLDPFCGSGTIVYESQRWGLTTYGVDNNPLACTLSRAKTQPFDKSWTLESLRQILERAADPGGSPDMPELVNRYFHPDTGRQIMRVQQNFDAMNDYLKGAYFGAIALAARACNHYRWSSNSTGKVFTPHRRVDFFKLFTAKTCKHMKTIEHVAPCSILRHDSRRLSEIIPDGSIDFVYTSPPYFDSLDYTSYYGRIIYSIIGEERQGIRGGLIQSLAAYERDMKRVMSEIEHVTNERAAVIFVVGDKKAGNSVVNGGEFFSRLCDWKPSYIVEREYTGSSSQIWDSINGTKRREQIIVWDRAAA